MKPKKILGIVMITILLANVLLFAFRIYDSTVFWGVIILGAIIAYMLPKINMKGGNK
ncbi:MAG: hypothetical protein ACP5NW_02395 [Candidatus Woesearchaeota archaeon]